MSNKNLYPSWVTGSADALDKLVQDVEQTKIQASTQKDERVKALLSKVDKSRKLKAEIISAKKELKNEDIKAAKKKKERIERLEAEIIKTKKEKLLQAEIDKVKASMTPEEIKQMEAAAIAKKELEAKKDAPQGVDPNKMKTAPIDKESKGKELPSDKKLNDSKMKKSCMTAEEDKKRSSYLLITPATVGDLEKISKVIESGDFTIDRVEDGVVWLENDAETMDEFQKQIKEELEKAEVKDVTYNRVIYSAEDDLKEPQHISIPVFEEEVRLGLFVIKEDNEFKKSTKTDKGEVYTTGDIAEGYTEDDDTFRIVVKDSSDMLHKYKRPEVKISAQVEERFSQLKAAILAKRAEANKLKIKLEAAPKLDEKELKKVKPEQVTKETTRFQKTTKTPEEIKKDVDTAGPIAEDEKKLFEDVVATISKLTEVTNAKQAEMKKVTDTFKDPELASSKAVEQAVENYYNHAKVNNKLGDLAKLTEGVFVGVYERIKPSGVKYTKEEQEKIDKIAGEIKALNAKKKELENLLGKYNDFTREITILELEKKPKQVTIKTSINAEDQAEMVENAEAMEKGTSILEKMVNVMKDIFKIGQNIDRLAPATA